MLLPFNAVSPLLCFSLLLCFCERSHAFLPRGVSDGSFHHAAALLAVPSSMQWQELDGGCKLLTTTTTPKAVVHFLGGAFVSPQPTVAYRYVLEELTKKGYAIVATPFAVDFEYRKPAAEIRDKFSRACRELEATNDNIADFRSLPLLAMGHSLGALMQVLLACEYPDDHGLDTTVGAALISYNNKNVDGAIPAFKELFVPALGPLEPLTRDPNLTDAFTRAQDLRRSGFDAVRSAAKSVQDALGLQDDESLITGVRPLVLKALDDVEAAAELVDQIPGVVASIAKGASEFEPTPSEMRILVAESYQQKAPLIVRFTDDSIDESDALAAVLPDRLGVQRADLKGTHVTPLAIDPNADSTPLLPIPDVLADGPVGNLRQELLANADALVRTLDDYFTESIETARANTTVRKVEELLKGDAVDSIVNPSIPSPSADTTDATDATDAAPINTVSVTDEELDVNNS